MSLLLLWLELFSAVTEGAVLSPCFQLQLLLVTITRYFAVIFSLKKIPKSPGIILVLIVAVT